MESRGGCAGPEPPRITNYADSEQLGPVSPELVLVDPALRAAALARLEVREPLDGRPARTAPRPLPPVAVAATAPPPPAELPVVREYSRWRIAVRLAPAIVPMALIFGVIVAMAGSETRYQSPALIAPTGDVAATRPQAKPPAPVAKAHTPRVIGSRSGAERAVLLAVAQRPRGKVPAALIDRHTGLAKNGLQARCRRTGLASFLCLVGSQHRPGLPHLKVTYRIGADGRGLFAWSK